MPEDIGTNDQLQIKVSIEALENVEVTVIQGKQGAVGNRKLVNDYIKVSDPQDISFGAYDQSVWIMTVPIDETQFWKFSFSYETSHEGAVGSSMP